LEELKSAVERILAMAAAGSWSLPEFAYRFVLAHPAVSTALVGTAFVQELKAAVEYCARGPLTSQWQARARQVTIQDRSQLNPGNWRIEP
jgi:aryl-alcohol dehydrogenase-like predicted oxidoreductase